MSLPVALENGYVSVRLAQSEQGIMPLNSNNCKVGVIDSIVPVSEFGEIDGRIILFEVNDKTIVVNYSNQDYYLIKSTEIISVEDEVPPAP